MSKTTIELTHEQKQMLDEKQKHGETYAETVERLIREYGTH